MAKDSKTITVFDGWQNLLTGLGLLETDKRKSTRFAADRRFTEAELRNLYAGEGISKQVIEIPVLEMTSAGFKVKGDPEGMVVARLEETGILTQIQNLLRWGMLYGGSLGVLGLEDGGLYDAPVNVRNLRAVTHLHVFTRYQITWSTGDLYRDAQHPKFGQPQFYWVYPINGTGFRVHESRTVRVDGMPVDDFARSQNNGWGDPIYKAIYEGLRKFAGVLDSVEFIVDDFSHGVYKVKNLADLLAMPDGESKILTRFAWMAKTQHVANDKIIDAELEDYQKVTATVTGLPDIIDRFMLLVAALARIPASRLFGRSPAGLNATGEFDDKAFAKRIAADQTKDLTPVLERICELVFQSRNYFFEGVEPENWAIEYNPIAPPTEKERADIKKTEGDTLAALVGAGILTEEEARATPGFADCYGIDPDETLPTHEPEDEPPTEEPPTLTGDRDDLQPAQRAALLASIARAGIRDKRGRRRADAADFVVTGVALNRAGLPTPAEAREWAKRHGLEVLDANVTSTRYRLDVAVDNPAGLVPRSEKYFQLAPGLEVCVQRVRRG